MERTYIWRTNLGVGLGLILKLLGAVRLAQYQDGLSGGPLLVVGLGLFLWGCASYAKGKGYPGLYGLLGLLSVWGLIILALLKARPPGAPSPAPTGVTLGQKVGLACVTLGVLYVIALFTLL